MEIKERPILFSAPMVRAILSGAKTQTRRIVKPQPAPNLPNDGGTHWSLKDGLFVPYGTVGHLTVKEKMGLKCPYGKPGERLWVRETFFIDDYRYPDRSVDVAEYLEAIDYRASHDCRDWEAGCPCAKPSCWKPSIHMPRWASRILLEVVNVRVERLNDISKADAIAEGIDTQGFATRRAVPFFADLWAKINGPDSWAANPWVWVVTFKRPEAPQ